MGKRIGALWKKSKEGKQYLAGSIELINGIHQRIAVFKNERKEKPEQPDYNIVLSDNLDDKKPAVEKVNMKEEF